jgi:hypothetical protein
MAFASYSTSDVGGSRGAIDHDPVLELTSASAAALHLWLCCSASAQLQLVISISSSQLNLGAASALAQQQRQQHKLNRASFHRKFSGSTTLSTAISLIPTRTRGKSAYVN